MAVIDVVKYDGSDQEFVWKFPSENLRLGSQLVVKTAQTAFFVRGGEVLDQFGPGTETLKSANLPLLHKMVSMPFGGDTPFQAEVWFVNRISKLDNRWGTPAAIQLEDPKYGVVVPVRAFGQFGLNISDPRQFLESVVGTVKLFSAEKLVEYFTGKIINAFATALGEYIVTEKVSILSLPALYRRISEDCQGSIAEELAKFGVGLPNFYVMSINVPENDSSVQKLKEFKEKSLEIGGLGKDVYQFDRSMDVMNTAASNPGSGGEGLSAGLGLGMGLGAGVGAGQAFGSVANNLQPGLGGSPPNNPPPGSPPSAPTAGPPPPPPPPSSTLTFHVYVAGAQYGPYPLDTLIGYLREGRIAGDAMVWRQGMANWTAANQTPEIIQALEGPQQGQTAPPPPPPPQPPAAPPAGPQDAGGPPPSDGNDDQDGGNR